MFEIILNHSRSFGGYEELTSVKDAEVWRNISQSFSRVVLAHSNNAEATVDIDWSSRVAYEQKCSDFYRALRGPSPPSKGMDFEFVHVCPARVHGGMESGLRSKDGSDELHRLLLDIYLIANLSCPGSFNLHRSYIRDTTRRPETDPLAQTDLELSEYSFETAWHEAQSLKWLKVDFVPFADALRWHSALDLSGKNVAANDVERALFSLLHLGRASFMDPTATLWLASALEALFDTPSGSSFTFLCKRVALLLELNKDENTELKRRLRSFFDLRNAFAHGGGPILHPLADDRDKQVEASIGNLLCSTNFALAVLIGSVQELIRRGWRSISFEERIASA